MPPSQDRPSLPRLDFSLPTLPQTLTPLLQGCRDSETPIGELADLAARDLALSTKVLRLANSAFIGARTPFTSVQQAIIYLGRDTLQSLTISIAVQEVFDKKMAATAGINREEFWYHALLSALLAKDLAEQSGLPNPAACYLAGLLHDTGKLLLAHNYPERYSERPLDNGALSLAWEKKHCALDHADAGALLVDHWHLPTALGEAIADHHSPPDDGTQRHGMKSIVFLANSLARSCQDLHPTLLAHAQRLGLSEESLLDSALRQTAEVQAFAATLDILVSPAPPPRTLGSTNDAGEIEKNLAPLGLLLGSLDHLSRAQELEQVFRILEESLITIFAIDKAVFLLPMDEKHRLVVRGSRRNRLARELAQAGPVPNVTERFLEGEGSSSLPIVWTRSPQADAQEARFFDLFKHDSLLALPFAGSLHSNGLLLYHSGEAMSGNSPERLQSLLLLLAHIGRRLQLEELQHKHAETIAGERIATIEEAARSLAHEISNPLAVVRNYLLLIEERKDLPTGLGSDLRAIGREVARIEAISRQLNHLGRLPAQSNLEPLHLPALIGEIVEVFTAMAREKKISLHCHAQNGLPRICADRQILEQVLHNLIINAIEAVVPGGWVRVRCYAGEGGDDSGQEVIIEVVDNGPGLSAIARERLYRAGYSTKGEGHAGLGLAIVRKLTADLGGRIDCLPSAERGTTFFLHFPAHGESDDCHST